MKLPPAARLLRDPESQPRHNSKSAPAKMRFPKFGRAKNRSAAVAPTISFEPMIMSFHQITYEVRKYHQFKDTFCICAFAFSVNLLEGSNNRFIAIANK